MHVLGILAMGILLIVFRNYLEKAIGYSLLIFGLVYLLLNL